MSACLNIPFKERMHCAPLHADGPQRATRSHPARGPEYGNVAAKDGWPTIPGAKNLWEMFHNRCAASLSPSSRSSVVDATLQQGSHGKGCSTSGS